MAVVSDSIQYLPKLKLITLPQMISSYDPTLFQSMRDQLLERNPPAQIDLKKLENYANCKIFRPSNVEPDNETVDDSDNDSDDDSDG